MGSRSETFAESTFRAIKCGQNAGKIQTRLQGGSPTISRSMAADSGQHVVGVEWLQTHERTPPRGQ